MYRTDGRPRNRSNPAQRRLRRRWAHERIRAADVPDQE